MLLVGASFRLTGSADIAPPQGDASASAPDIAVLSDPSPETTAYADDLTRELRLAGISVWDVIAHRPMKHHLKSVAQIGARYSVFVGRRELTSGNYSIRDRNGDLVTVGQTEIGFWLLRAAGRGPGRRCGPDDVE
jgi:histidyl-tRNA synthetase